MLNLVLTTDKLQLVTDAAVTVDVHASFVDLNGTTVTPGKTNTAITTAATTDIVASPAASTVRNVKTLHVRNKHASSSLNVTVVYDANGTDYELHKVNLRAGEALEYIEGIGFFTLVSPTPNFQTKALAADQSNSTTTLTEVTGLGLVAGPGTYQFEYRLIYQSGVTTTGVRFSVNHDGTVTLFVANVEFGAGTTASSDAPDQDLVAAGAQITSMFAARAKSTLGWGTTLSVDTANADMLTIIRGAMVVTVEGNIELWHGSEVAAISTLKAGSSLVLNKMAA
jgi:hypothetical protein